MKVLLWNEPTAVDVRYMLRVDGHEVVNRQESDYPQKVHAVNLDYFPIVTARPEVIVYIYCECHGEKTLRPFQKCVEGRTDTPVVFFNVENATRNKARLLAELKWVEKALAESESPKP